VENGQPGYRVEISREAWREVGIIPSDAFARLREHLREMARGEEGPSAGAVQVDGYRVEFELDAERRRLLVRRLYRAASGL
jgi:hypothetical protein